MGSYVNGVYVPTLAETGWDDEVSDALDVLGHGSIDPTLAPYGADRTGISDSSGPIQAALDDMFGGAASGSIPTPARFGSDGPGHVRVGGGVFRIDSPLSIRSVRGGSFTGAGIDATVFVVHGSIDQFLDLYGVSHMRIGGFSVVGVGGYGGGGQVTYGISWDWVSGQSTASSSRCVFENIWVRDLDFKYGFGIGVESANYDVSHGMFRHVNVNGNTTLGDANTTLWQSAFQVGSGTPGNVLNFDFDDCTHEAVKTNYYVNNVSKVSVRGGGATSFEHFTYKVGPGELSLSDMRLEEGNRIAGTPGGATYTSDLFIDRMHWDPGSSGDDDGIMIDWNYSGTVGIRGLYTRIPTNNSLYQRINVGTGADKPVQVNVDGASIGGLETLSDLVQVTSASAEVVADFRGVLGIADDGGLTATFPAQTIGYGVGEGRINPHSVRLGGTAGPLLLQGLGSPEGAVTGAPGSVFASRNAGFFYKGTGYSDTGWKLVTSTSATGPYIPPTTTATNLLAWFDANEIIGLSDGDLVGTWEDSTGQTTSLTQSDTTLRPAWKSSIVNGYPVVRWTTGNEYLFALDHEAAVALAGSDKPMTVFVVFKRTSARAGDDVPFRFASHSQPNALHDPVFIGGAGNDVKSERQDNASSNVMLTSVASGDTNFNVWTSKFTGTVMTVYKDGGTGITSITGAAMNVGTTGLDSVFIGASATLIGDVAEVLVYDTALADTPRHEIQAYLGTKYGISIT